MASWSSSFDSGVKSANSVVAYYRGHAVNMGVRLTVAVNEGEGPELREANINR